jgi:hypothetical protein
MVKIFALGALSLMGVMGVTDAASPTGASCRYTTSFTCHEECSIKCYKLYPGNMGMHRLCTFSCIDQNCGGGPFPAQPEASLAVDPAVR